MLQESRQARSRNSSWTGLSLDDYMILMNQMNLSPPIPKPDLTRIFLDTVAAAEKTSEAVAKSTEEGELGKAAMSVTSLNFDQFVECIYRCARHSTLDSRSLGSEARNRLASALATIARSTAATQLEQQFSIKMNFALPAQASEADVLEGRLGGYMDAVRSSPNKLAEVDRAMHRMRAAAYGRMGSRNLDALFDLFDTDGSKELSYHCALRGGAASCTRNSGCNLP